MSALPPPTHSLPARPPTSTNPRPPPPPPPPPPHPRPNPNATWDCDLCGRSMLRMSRRSHLRGKAHLSREADATKRAPPPPPAPDVRTEEQRITQRNERLEAKRLAKAAEDRRRMQAFWRQLEEEKEMELERVQEEIRVRQEALEQNRVRQMRVLEEEIERERVQAEARRVLLQREEEERRLEQAVADERRIVEEERVREEVKQQKILLLQQQREDEQRRQQQRQDDELLAREQQALILQAEARAPAVKPAATTHNSDGDAGYRAKMFQYLESQGIMHEGYSGAAAGDVVFVPAPASVSPSPQVVTEYDRTGGFPAPVVSVTDLPPILYRVYDDTSVSKYYWQGFQAGALFMPLDPLGFKNMVQRHGNWSSREGTPFVSVTSSPDAAGWHVAKKKAGGGVDTNIMVALIDTAALLGPGGTTVWKMHDAMDHFGLLPWKCERRAYDNEYLCALRIPPAAVFACCQPDYFMDTALVFLKNLEWREGGKTAPRGKTVLTIRAPDAVVLDAVVLEAVASEGSVSDEVLVSQDVEAVETVRAEEVVIPGEDEALGSDEGSVSEVI